MTKHHIIEDLDPGKDDQYELVEHPLEITEEEEKQGLAAYEAVDDLDDEDDGMNF